MGEKIFVENWQQQLELLSFENNERMDKAYICSPLRADTQQEFLQNIHAARAYMFYARQRLGFHGRAPHAYLPLVLCDFDPKEREIALKFGLELLEQSKVIPAKSSAAVRLPDVLHAGWNRPLESSPRRSIRHLVFSPVMMVNITCRRCWKQT